ncbi:MAG: UDP-N-acetylgalactosamine-undecaprenyl-phosphate N-acetylgalactosaminephosphotransferase [Burkholderiaceae bacterium]|nr:UDP-N-acetylgalactosamine-undecaprenyl-phosphate N-acetylgalactosaminephosphotransferase [Burkholderiaceae bacterium]
MVKRALDLALAALVLTLVSPLLLAAMIWVRIDSPGPVLFRQERVGRHGLLFRIHKLRTMHVDAPAVGPAITAHADERVTRAGRWLRRYRIDELPQLIDVLRGDMSLVGPRPEVPRFVALYPAELRAKVLAVRPGITDPASLEFVDESELLAGSPDPERAYVETILPRKLQRQVQYAERATWWSDLAVMARTLRVLFAR